MKLWSGNFNALSLDIDREGHAEYWLKGGRGSGKSTFIARKILLGMLAHPRASAVVYRRVAATLRQSVYEECIKAIDALGLRPWCVFRLSPLEIRFKPTGQRILFRGADDAGKSKSITLASGYFGYLWFEEASEFPGMEDIETIEASVLRGHADQRPIAFFSYNPPKSAQNWINKAVIAPRDGRLVHHSSYNELPRAWIGESFIAAAEAMRQSNERAYRHMYLGEVTGSGGQVFDNVVLRPVTDVDINAIGKFCNGLDFGFAVDPDAFTRWGWNPRERALVAVAEYYGAHTPIDTLAEKVKALAGGEVVRCDSADPRMIAELRRRGVNAAGVKKGPGSVEHGMRWLQDLGQIIIDPARTPNTAREYSAYEYESDRNGNFLPDYPDRNNHTIDSCRYALEPEIGQKRVNAVSKGVLGL
jgi:PBSX family phage terminase large subunit